MGCGKVRFKDCGQLCHFLDQLAGLKLGELVERQVTVSDQQVFNIAEAILFNDISPRFTLNHIEQPSQLLALLVDSLELRLQAYLNVVRRNQQQWGVDLEQAVGLFAHRDRLAHESHVESVWCWNFGLVETARAADPLLAKVAKVICTEEEFGEQSDLRQGSATVVTRVTVPGLEWFHWQKPLKDFLEFFLHHLLTVRWSCQLDYRRSFS